MPARLLEQPSIATSMSMALISLAEINRKHPHGSIGLAQPWL